MALARGTPFRFIGANEAGALLIWAFVLGDGTLTRAGPTDAPRTLLLAAAFLSILWGALLVFFFRDPERRPGPGVVAPADGRVRQAEIDGNRAVVSTILGPLNVHVVRSPIEGRVARVERRAGARRLAFSKDAAANERLVMRIEGKGEVATLTMIAGAFADRIEPYVAEGALLLKGERLGIIKFGSRVDLEHESEGSLSLKVEVGNSVIGGATTILAPAREGARP